MKGRRSRDRGTGNAYWTRAANGPAPPALPVYSWWIALNKLRKNGYPVNRELKKNGGSAATLGWNASSEGRTVCLLALDRVKNDWEKQ